MKQLFTELYADMYNSPLYVPVVGCTYVTIVLILAALSQ